MNSEQRHWPRWRGGRATPTYSVWHNMNARCEQEGRCDADLYRDKGIRVCTRWTRGRTDGRGFDNFCDDMGERPSLRHTIGRIFNDLGYGPNNCKWMDWSEQNHWQGGQTITVDGVTMTKEEWAAHLGIKYRSLCRREQLFPNNPNIYRVPRGGRLRGVVA